MSLNKETIALATSIIFVAAVFAYPVYYYFIPEQRIWTAKIFATYQIGSNTLIMSYGNGILLIPGHYVLKNNVTYKITYLISGKSSYYGADKVISYIEVG